VPGGGSGTVVARLDPEASVKQGQDAELWVDTSRIHFFDVSDGRALTGDAAAAPAAATPTAGQGDGASGDGLGDDA
jgi:multiple sugar transport system ATP-binding protein